MPWEIKKHTEQPAPSAYDVSSHRSMGSQCSQHSARSAAFASSSDRFPKPRPAAGDAGESSPFHHRQAMARTHDGLRRSASFSSGSRRLKPSHSQSPGPNQYYPRPASQVCEYSNSAKVAVSAGLASTLARKLPFEHGGGRGTDLSTPGPARYTPHSAAEYRGRGHGPTTAKSGVATKGGAALGYTSPRFTNGHYNHARNDKPGPGAYDAGTYDRRTLGSAYNVSGAVPRSTEERRLQFDIRPTPGAAAYSPRASARGVGEMHPQAASTPSAAFASASRRLAVERARSPGPGAYEAEGVPARTLRRSASFGSQSKRFKHTTTIAPGPGRYNHDALASPRRQGQISASFASTSERIQLPTNPMHAIVPGPGGYDHPNPVADYARPLRRSASFSSGSERLRTPRRDTPPPGAYNPQMSSRGRACAGATQRYSITRIAS